MRTRLVVSALLVLTLVLSSRSPAYAAPTVWEGRWAVNGHHSLKGDYTGTLTITRVSGSNYAVAGDLVYADGKKDSVTGNAVLSGWWGTKTFKYSYKTAGGGILDALSTGNAAGSVTIRATLRGDKKKMTGSWFVVEKPDVKGNETLTHIKEMAVTGVEPKDVDAGTDNREVRILGRNLPLTGTLDVKDVGFLTGTAADATIKVNRILDFSDDGSSIKVSLTVAKESVPGKRSIKVADAVGKDLFTVNPPELRLKLGGSQTATAGTFLKLFVPDQSGGDLTLSGAAVELHQGTKDGPVVAATAGETWTFAENKAGWYFVKIVGSGNGTLTANFVQKGEVTGAKKPWNFWYFPFYERGTDMNLYCENGAYEKLDKVLGLKHDADGYKKFDKSRHMDKDFKEPTDDKDKAKYDQTTTKGWAYCYARSTDSKKSWWGHCWGAAVASSIYQQPKALTVKAADGSDVAFTEEEAEGLLTDYFTNHSVNPVNYVNDCPAGRPTDALKEECDEYADDFFVGLQTGIRKNGLPLASNLRAQSTSDDDKDQVWNHVVWKYEARFKEVEGKDDPTYLQVDLDVTATDDRFPSGPDVHRDESYVLRFKYDENGALQRDNKDFQNWVSADHYCPSYLWRINSATPWGTENQVMADKLPKLESIFKHAKINQ